MAVNKHSKAFQRLQLIVAELKHQSAHIDETNSHKKSHRKIEDTPVFSVNLFQTRSDKFISYAFEIERKIKELQKHLLLEHDDIIESLLVKIEQQISSLTNAIAANDSIHNNIDKTQKARQFSRKKYQKAAKAIMQPTHTLYQKLSEHHEFERRLALMIAEREQVRSNSQNKSQNNEKLKVEILALHQRLGRCRQAISIIERDIELAEKRSSNFSKS
jgi:primosomal replication protein N''